MAAALGVLLTQLAFLGHEASHRQVLSSGPANDRLGWFLAVVCRRDELLVVDEQAHPPPREPEQDRQRSRHRDRHLLLRGGDAATRRGFKAWFTRQQGLFFFPLLLLEGINLHLKSVQSLWENRRVARVVGSS